MTADHITQPYTLAELRDKIATHEYSAELLLQHAMLLLDRQSPAEAQRYSPDGNGGMEIDSLGAWVRYKPQPKHTAMFDAEGFRAWVRSNLPDDTIIGNSAWWAAHLSAWAARFVKTQAPESQDEDDEPVPTRGTDAIVHAWNALPNELRLSQHLVRLFEAVKTCRDVDSSSPAVKDGRAARAWAALTEPLIDEFLEDYEMVGEDEAGRDACHVPTEGERALIKDAIMGLLAEADSVGYMMAGASPASAPGADRPLPAELGEWLTAIGELYIAMGRPPFEASEPTMGVVETLREAAKRVATIEGLQQAVAAGFPVVARWTKNAKDGAPRARVWVQFEDGGPEVEFASELQAPAVGDGQ